MIGQVFPARYTCERRYAPNCPSLRGASRERATHLMTAKLPSSWREHPQLTLAAITLVPRLVLLAAAEHRATPFGAPAHDGYLQIAGNLVRHGTFGLDPNHLLTRGPLFPLLLAPGVAMGHPELWNAVVHLAASVGTCLLVFAAAETLTGNLSASFCAAAFVTLDPWLIWFVKNPMTTVTATFFVACAVYFFAQLLAARRPKWSALGLGGACALAALDHPALAALVGGFTLAILVASAGAAKLSQTALRPKNAMIALGGMWAAFFAILLPWSLRNFRDSGRPVLISDGAGLSYFMGATRYELSPYPWANVQWKFDDVAERLHVSVADLDVQYFTIDDRDYPALTKQARADFLALAARHPAFLAKRTAVMAFWFLAGDYSVARTAAHCVFLALILLGAWFSWRARGWSVTVPFLVIILPGLALHSLTMALIGHAAYAIPYVVPLSMPVAFALAKEPVPDSSRVPAAAGATSGIYALE